MSKYNLVRDVLVVALAFGLLGCSAASTATPRPFNYMPQPIEPRQITKNTLNWQEHWRVSQSYIGGIDQPLLLASSGRVVCTQRDFARDITQLAVYDAASGNLLWKVPGEYGTGTLAVDTERAYFMQSFEPRAYDLNDGKVLWTSELLDHRGYDFYVDGDELHARDRAQGVNYYFDVRTGEKLGQASLKTDDGFVLLAQFPQFDLYVNRTTLRAIDKISLQVLWEVPQKYPRPVFNNVRPVLFDDVLLVGYMEPVYAIDTQTGQVTWSYPDEHFASNFIIADGSLYALDTNARLVQLDIETGQETGYIQFTPAQIDFQENRYWVAADGQMLFISFDDSQELIALGP